MFGMELHTVWFILIAFLWVAYFTLEGFDMGVGILMPILGRNDRERRQIINTIGPVWDGNEVWLLTAGGATFAAFPEWYATLFSGFYLPLLLIVLALIVRGVAFEYRHQRPGATWKLVGPGDLLGLAGAGVPVGGGVRQHRPRCADRREQGVHGQPVHPAQPDRAARRLRHADPLRHPRRDLPGAQDRRSIRVMAREVGLRLAVVTAVLAIVFMAWVQLDTGNVGSAVLFVLAAFELVTAWLALKGGREGWAFTGTFLCIAFAVTGLFVALFPDVMPSTTNELYSLTVDNASATEYTLKVMTVTALIFAPIVVAYQAWSYWVFRHRVLLEHIPELEHEH